MWKVWVWHRQCDIRRWELREQRGGGYLIEKLQEKEDKIEGSLVEVKVNASFGGNGRWQTNGLKILPKLISSPCSKNDINSSPKTWQILQNKNYERILIPNLYIHKRQNNLSSPEEGKIIRQGEPSWKNVRKHYWYQLSNSSFTAWWEGKLLRWVKYVQSIGGISLTKSIFPRGQENGEDQEWSLAFSSKKQGKQNWISRGIKAQMVRQKIRYLE